MEMTVQPAEDKIIDLSHAYSLMPNNGAALRVQEDGSVNDGLRILCRFPSKEVAESTLARYGFIPDSNLWRLMPLCLTESSFYDHRELISWAKLRNYITEQETLLLRKALGIAFNPANGGWSQGTRIGTKIVVIQYLSVLAAMRSGQIARKAA